MKTKTNLVRVWWIWPRQRDVFRGSMRGDNPGSTEGLWLMHLCQQPVPVLGLASHEFALICPAPVHGYSPPSFPIPSVTLWTILWLPGHCEAVYPPNSWACRLLHPYRIVL